MTNYNNTAMELTRIIHPVGQGGFYSERLVDGSNEINVIYDCGGNNNTSMREYLDNYYTQRTIDAVFISHMHDDHINGLEYLLTHNNVKCLILPQLTKDEHLEFLLYNALKNPTGVSGINSFINKLLSSEDYYTESETKIIRVSHSNGDDRIGEEIVGDYDIDLLKMIKMTSIKSGVKIHLGKEWLFIPYNPPINSNYDKGFYNFFKGKLKINYDFGFEDLIDIVHKEGLKKCKQIYDDYFEKNHNAYSMTLFSGMASPHLYSDYCDCCYDKMIYHHCGKYRRLCSPNCLYTGDFDTKNQFKNLKYFYAPYWKTISSIQVPHHGSRNNFDPQMYEYASRGFISVGEKNRYHHPNVDTLIGMHGMCCNPVLVTDSLSTIKLYQYHI
jgi:hypothetical protein